MSQLTTKKIYTTPPPQQALAVDFVKPVSYDFRVLDQVDSSGKVVKVKLQVQVWEHDEFGSGTVKQFWKDVPRVRVDETGTIIVP